MHEKLAFEALGILFICLVLIILPDLNQKTFEILLNTDTLSNLAHV